VERTLQNASKSVPIKPRQVSFQASGNFGDEAGSARDRVKLLQLTFLRAGARPPCAPFHIIAVSKHYRTPQPSLVSANAHLWALLTSQLTGRLCRAPQFEGARQSLPPPPVALRIAGLSSRLLLADF
jgi:hypothetical protein